jgi:hypothetical protein
MDATHEQVEPVAVLSAQLSSNSSTSSEHTNSYISSDYQSLLPLESCSEGNNDWPSGNRIHIAHRENSLYRESARNNGSNLLPQGQMSLPRFGTQFSLEGTSLQVADANGDYPQQQEFGQASGSRKDVLVSPISLLGPDERVGMELAKPSRPDELLSLHRTRRTSVSRAERMIKDVENLYEFGIRLAIFPEDPLLRKSLRRMKERFRHLAKSGVSSDHRDIYEGSSSQTDSDT